jgi:hypothetical protein
MRDQESTGAQALPVGSETMAFSHLKDPAASALAGLMPARTAAKRPGLCTTMPVLAKIVLEPVLDGLLFR